MLFRSVGKGGRIGATDCTPARCRASSRRWRGRLACRKTVTAGLSGPLGPGGRGAGHGGRRHRTAGDPPCRAVEIDGDGEPLRRTPAGPAQRGRATGPDAETGIGGWIWIEPTDSSIPHGQSGPSGLRRARPRDGHADASRARIRKMLSSVKTGAGGGSGVRARQGQDRTGKVWTDPANSRRSYGISMGCNL